MRSPAGASLKVCLSGIMPCCSGSNEQARIDRSISTALAAEAKQQRGVHRLLFLGTAGSGKSTIVKQLSILHGQSGLDQPEKRKEYACHIRRNVLESITTIVDAMKQLNPPVCFECLENEVHVEFLKSIPDFSQISAAHAKETFYHVKALWSDKGVKECHSRWNEYPHVIDCAEYFLNKVDEIGRDDFIPSEQDVLRCRVRTTAIYETRFELDHVKFQPVVNSVGSLPSVYSLATFLSLFDVGGQKSERRKWVQCFNDVTCILFVASTSAYNLCQREKDHSCRLQESLDLFSSIWNNRWLGTVSVILFLNKHDLFREKIFSGRWPLEKYFPDFTNYQLHAYDSPQASHTIAKQNLYEQCLLSESFSWFLTDNDLVVIFVEEVNVQKLAIVVQHVTPQGTVKQVVPNVITDRSLRSSRVSQSTLSSGAGAALLRASATGGLHRFLYPHFTCAVDAENIRRVFQNCKNIVQRLYLEHTPLF